MLEYTLKFAEKPNGKSSRISVGYNGFSNEEISSYRFIFGKPLVSTSYSVNVNDINDKINEDVNSGLLVFTEESTGAYKSKLIQMVNAGYVNAFFNFGDKWEINAGVRAENSTRETKYREVSDSFTSKFRKITKEKLDFTFGESQIFAQRPQQYPICGLKNHHQTSFYRGNAYRLRES
jgi:adenylate cyclase